MIRYFKFLFICFLISCFSNFSSAVAERIQNIEVHGNRRIERDTIITNLGISIGDNFSKGIQSKALKSLYATGFFENIIIDFKSGKFLVQVKEFPFIAKVKFYGNHKLSEHALSEAILTYPGTVLTHVTLQSDIQKLQELYQNSGYFAAKIKSEIQQIENGRAILNFKISEGKKTFIRKVAFVGNSAYSTSELKSVIFTKEANWFRFFNPHTGYNSDRLDFDKAMLLSFYRKNGFLDCNIISVNAELSSNKDYFIITYLIDEGHKYYIGNVELQNNIIGIDTTQINKYLSEIKPNSLVNTSKLDNIVEKISDELVKKGFYQTDVSYELSKQTNQRISDIIFIIERAEKPYVRRIEILGNTKTEDRVIRRELVIAEGDLFEQSKLDKSERNLMELDFFENVKLQPIIVDNSNHYDLLVEVKEKSTAEIGASAGYSTVEGISGALSFKEHNLLGKGLGLGLNVERSSYIGRYSMGITDPYFLNQDLTLTMKATLATRKYKESVKGSDANKQNFASKLKEFSPSIGYYITDNIKHNVGYKIRSYHINLPKDNDMKVINEEQGKFLYSILFHSLIYNKVNSTIAPRNGYIIEASQSYAGIGGNVKYIKHEIEGRFYKSFYNNQLTFLLVGRYGDIRGLDKEPTKINDRFSVGDSNLRGFEQEGIGPRHKSMKEALGGKKYYTGTAEVIFPLGLPKELDIKGSVFADIGSLWDFDLSKKTKFHKEDFHNDKSMRASVGLGITWNTKIIPITIDYAFPIKKESYDDTQNLHIRFSTKL